MTTTDAQTDAEPVRLTWMAGWTRWERLGVSLATIPLLINFRFSYVTSDTAFGLSTGGFIGAIACLLGLRCLFSVWTSPIGKRRQRFFLGLLLLMMGGVHLTGFSMTRL